MKKILIICGLLSISTLVGCSNSHTTLTFKQDEFSIYSGNQVVVNEKYKGITYAFVDNDYENINLDATTGTITYDDQIPNAAQVLYVANYKNIQSEPVVITLLHDYEEATIKFQNLSDYIVDGEFITGTASLPYAVTYTLKNKIPGISINEYTGKVSYTSNVEDGIPFVVIAHTHNNVEKEKTFYTMTKNFITVESNRQISEKGSNQRATFVLDFSANPSVKTQGIVALTNEKNVLIDSSNYDYDATNCILHIKADYLNTLMDGENIFKIITARNAIKVKVEVATKFIYTAEDLSSINNSIESLQGYYILMDDIDMSQYLAKGGNGYNDGKGWTPIGLYDDVLDYNLSTLMAFKGTFDGNGHVIRNVTAIRQDERSFNCGLFGYLTSSAVIKNLGVTGSFKVSSYSGGLVGSNAGTITNCWADVQMEVYSGEGVYRYVGGFVGNNFGIIENCYALGDVLCDSDYGAFAGYNEGDIINCYAIKSNAQRFVGFGSVPQSSLLLDNLEQMQNLNWTEIFPDEYWILQNGQLPSLKNTLQEYDIRRIVLDKIVLESNYFIGDNITFKTIIYPSSFQEICQDQLVYSVKQNGGVYFDGNVLHTLNAKTSEVEITVSLQYGEDLFQDSLTIYLNKKIEQLIMERSMTILKAGNSYKLTASYLPVDATEDIIYNVRGSSLQGIILDGDILTLEENVVADEIEIFATSAVGNVRSNSLIFPIDKIENLGKCILYLDEITNISLTLDSKYDLEDMVITCYGKVVKYDLANNTIIIQQDYVNDFLNTQIPFMITLKNGTRLRFDVYVMSHPRFTYDYVKEHEQEVIEISSAADFAKYFNVLSHDDEKYENYQKVFVLTNDIDFKHQKIYGIGFSSDQFEEHSFKGKLYGCGHTISNFQIYENELALSSDPYPAKYGVGLFGLLDGGELYDINLSNVTIQGNNFVGGLVGMMKTGIVENCAVINDGTSKITASDYSVSNDNIHVGGIIGIVYGGKCIANYYWNTTINAIG